MWSVDMSGGGIGLGLEPAYTPIVDVTEPSPASRNAVHEGRASLREQISRAASKDRAPLLVVAAAVVFGLIVLWPERADVWYLNDASIHRSMVRWAADRIRDGHLPFDGWYPYLSLGGEPIPPLPVPPAHRDRHRCRSRSATACSAGRSTSCWRPGRSRSTRVAGCWAWVAGRPPPPPLIAPLIVERTGSGLRVEQLRLARLGNVGAALGDVGAAVRLGVVVASDRHGSSCVARRADPGSHDLSPPPDRVPRDVLAGGVRRGRATRDPPTTRARRRRRARRPRRRRMDAGAAPHRRRVDGQRRVQPGDLLLRLLRCREDPGVVGPGRAVRSRADCRSCRSSWPSAWSSPRSRPDEEPPRVDPGSGARLSLVLFFGRSTLGPVIDLLPGGQELFLRRFISGVHLAGIYLAGIGAVYLVSLIVDVLRRRRGERGDRARRGAVAALVVLTPAASSGSVTSGRAGRGSMSSSLSKPPTASGSRRWSIEPAIARTGRVFAGIRRGTQRLAYRIGQVPGFAALLEPPGRRDRVHQTDLVADVSL